MSNKFESIGKNYKARKSKAEHKKFIEIGARIFLNNYNESTKYISELINCEFQQTWPISFDQLVDEVTDYFPTYHALTQIYLDAVRFKSDDMFLEPAAGNGDISKVLRKNGYNFIHEIDIYPRNKLIKKLDFLTSNDFKIYDHIISNPPFKLSLEFIVKASKFCSQSINLLMPLDYLHGIKRYDNIWKDGINGFHLYCTYVFIRRPLFGSEYDPEGLMPTGATSFAWFQLKHSSLFSYGQPTEPRIRWLDNRDFMGSAIKI